MLIIHYRNEPLNYLDALTVVKLKQSTKKKRKSMPQIIVRHDPMFITVEALEAAAKYIRPLVAEAASTERVTFTENDIEWLPQPHHPGTIGAQDIALEIRTIGFPERKEKLNKAGVMELKKKIIEAGFWKHASMDAPLIWMQFIDEAGVHV
jgi:hypothetical protein